MDVAVVAVLAHVAANVAPAYPIERALQELLPVRATLHIRTPLLDIGVLAIAELGLGKRHERS